MRALPHACAPPRRYVARADANETLYESHIAWKTSGQPFQPGFEALVARGLERMFCGVCDHHHQHRHHHHHQQQQLS